jgi:hypothetical protein
MHCIESKNSNSIRKDETMIIPCSGVRLVKLGVAKLIKILAF